MAAKMVTNETPAIAQVTKPEGNMFEPFEWLAVPAGASCHERRAAELAMKTRDVSNGLATVLQMLEQDQLGDDHRTENEPKLMNDYHASNLQRLSITVLHMLGERAEAILNDMHQAAEKARTAAH